MVVSWLEPPIPVERKSSETLGLDGADTRLNLRTILPTDLGISAGRQESFLDLSIALQPVVPSVNTEPLVDVRVLFLKVVYQLVFVVLESIN